MSKNIYRTADRTITITCADNGDLLGIELHGNLSPARLSAELCRLHAKALPQYEQPYSNREIDSVIARLSEPPTPALAEIYGALHDSMATLRKAGEDLQAHPSEGSTEAVTVTISGRGCLTSVECKDKAKKLTANELATSLLEAYQQAKTAAQTYSEQWRTQLTAALEEINPVRVTRA